MVAVIIDVHVGDSDVGRSGGVRSVGRLAGTGRAGGVSSRRHGALHLIS